MKEGRPSSSSTVQRNAAPSGSEQPLLVATSTSSSGKTTTTASSAGAGGETRKKKTGGGSSAHSTSDLTIGEISQLRELLQKEEKITFPRFIQAYETVVGERVDQAIMRLTFELVDADGDDVISWMDLHEHISTIRRNEAMETDLLATQDIMQEVSRFYPQDKSVHHTGRIQRIIPVSRGDQLATSSVDGSVRLWNADTLEFEKALHFGTCDCLDMDYAPLSDLLFVLSCDDVVSVYHMGTQKLVRTLRGGKKSLGQHGIPDEIYRQQFRVPKNTPQFSHNGKAAPELEGSTLERFWRAKNSMLLQRMWAHKKHLDKFQSQMIPETSEMSSVTGCHKDIFSNVQQEFPSILFVGTNSGEVHGYQLHISRSGVGVSAEDPLTEPELYPQFKWQPHSAEITSMRTDRENDLILTSSQDSNIQLLNIERGMVLRTLKGSEEGTMNTHSRGVRSFEYSKSPKMIGSWGQERFAIIWDPVVAKPIQALHGHVARLVDLKFSSENEHHIFTYSEDRTIRIWDTRSFRCIQQIREQPWETLGSPGALFYNAKKHSIITGTNRLYWKDPVIDTFAEDYTGHHRAVLGACCSTKERMICSFDESSLRVWNSEKGTLTVWWPIEPLQAICVDGNGHSIAIFTGAEDLRVISATNGQLVLVLVGSSKNADVDNHDPRFIYWEEKSMWVVATSRSLLFYEDCSDHKIVLYPSPTYSRSLASLAHPVSSMCVCGQRMVLGTAGGQVTSIPLRYLQTHSDERLFPCTSLPLEPSSRKPRVSVLHGDIHGDVRLMVQQAQLLTLQRERQLSRGPADAAGAAAAVVVSGGEHDIASSGAASIVPVAYEPSSVKDGNELTEEKKNKKVDATFRSRIGSGGGASSFRDLEQLSHCVEGLVPLGQTPLVVSGDGGGYLRLWDIANSRELTNWSIVFAKSVTVSSVDATPDGNVLFAGDEMGYVSIFDIHNLMLHASEILATKTVNPDVIAKYISRHILFRASEENISAVKWIIERQLLCVACARNNLALFDRHGNRKFLFGNPSPQPFSVEHSRQYDITIQMYRKELLMQHLEKQPLGTAEVVAYATQNLPKLFPTTEMIEGVLREMCPVDPERDNERLLDFMVEEGRYYVLKPKEEATTVGGGDAGDGLLHGEDEPPNKLHIARNEEKITEVWGTFTKNVDERRKGKPFARHLPEHVKLMSSIDQKLHNMQDQPTITGRQLDEDELDTRIRKKKNTTTATTPGAVPLGGASVHETSLIASSLLLGTSGGEPSSCSGPPVLVGQLYDNDNTPITGSLAPGSDVFTQKWGMEPTATEKSVKIRTDVSDDTPYNVSPNLVTFSPASFAEKPLLLDPQGTSANASAGSRSSKLKDGNSLFTKSSTQASTRARLCKSEVKIHQDDPIEKQERIRRTQILDMEDIERENLAVAGLEGLEQAKREEIHTEEHAKGRHKIVLLEELARLLVVNVFEPERHKRSSLQTQENNARKALGKLEEKHRFVIFQAVEKPKLVKYVVEPIAGCASISAPPVSESGRSVRQTFRYRNRHHATENKRVGGGGAGGEEISSSSSGGGSGGWGDIQPCWRSHSTPAIFCGFPRTSVSSENDDEKDLGRSQKGDLTPTAGSNNPSGGLAGSSGRVLPRTAPPLGSQHRSLPSPKKQRSKQKNQSAALSPSVAGSITPTSLSLVSHGGANNTAFLNIDVLPTSSELGCLRPSRRCRSEPPRLQEAGDPPKNQLSSADKKRKSRGLLVRRPSPYLIPRASIRAWDVEGPQKPMPRDPFRWFCLLSDALQFPTITETSFKKKRIRVLSVAHSFQTNCVRLVEQIVAEWTFPASKKTVHQVSPYIWMRDGIGVHCVTNPVSARCCEGSYSRALKLSSNELRGLNSFLLAQERVPLRILTPLGCVVRLWGLSFYCSSVVPVQEGQKMGNDNNDDNNKLSSTAVSPSLRLSFESMKLDGSFCTASTPCGFRCECQPSGDLVALGFRRVLPIRWTTMQEAQVGIQLLRPEHVMNGGSLLASNSFDDAIPPLQRAKADRDGINAAHRLAGTAIPNLASFFMSCDSSVVNLSGGKIVEYFHSYGVNLAMMGEVAVHLDRLITEEPVFQRNAIPPKKRNGIRIGKPEGLATLPIIQSRNRTPTRDRKEDNNNNNKSSNTSAALILSYILEEMFARAFRVIVENEWRDVFFSSILHSSHEHSLPPPLEGNRSAAAAAAGGRGGGGGTSPSMTEFTPPSLSVSALNTRMAAGGSQASPERTPQSTSAVRRRQVRTECSPSMTKIDGSERGAAGSPESLHAQTQKVKSRLMAQCSELLRDLLGYAPGHRQFWETQLIPLINQKFPLKEVHSNLKYELASIDIVRLQGRIAHLLGLDIKNGDLVDVSSVSKTIKFDCQFEEGWEIAHWESLKTISSWLLKEEQKMRRMFKTSPELIPIMFSTLITSVRHHHKLVSSQHLSYCAELQQLTQKYYGPVSTWSAMTWEMQGMLLFTCGEMERAIWALETAAENYRNALGQHHPSVTRLMSLIVELLVEAGCTVTPFPTAASVSTLLREALSNHSLRELYSTLDLASGNLVLGKVCTDSAGSILQRRMSREYFDESFRIFSSVLGIETDLSMEALKCIAEAHGELEEENEAVDVYMKMISILCEHYGTYSSRVALCWDHVGKIYLKNHSLDKAKIAFQTALSMREKVGDRGVDPNLAISYNLFATVELARERPEDALTYLNHALSSLDGQPHDHPILLDVLVTLAKCYQKMERHADGVDVWQKILDARERKLGPIHEQTAEAMLHIGQLLFAQRMFHESWHALDVARGIRIRKFGEKHPLVAQSTMWIARCEGALGNTIEAVRLFDAAIATLDEALLKDIKKSAEKSDADAAVDPKATQRDKKRDENKETRNDSEEPSESKTEQKLQRRRSSIRSFTEDEHHASGGDHSMRQHRRTSFSTLPSTTTNTAAKKERYESPYTILLRPTLLCNVGVLLLVDAKTFYRERCTVDFRRMRELGVTPEIEFNAAKKYIECGHGLLLSVLQDLTHPSVRNAALLLQECQQEIDRSVEGREAEVLKAQRRKLISEWSQMEESVKTQKDAGWYRKAHKVMKLKNTI